MNQQRKQNKTKHWTWLLWLRSDLRHV